MNTIAIIALICVTVLFIVVLMLYIKSAKRYDNVRSEFAEKDKTLALSQAECETLREKAESEKREWGRIQESLNGDIKRLEEKTESDKKEREKLQDTFKAEFKSLANDILEEKSKQFKQTNKESMDSLLTPFRSSILEFRERVEKIYTFENEQRGALKNELKNLVELNKRITQETSNLTQALKGNSKVQGDWGEMILETILEQSNLQKGVHYFTQSNLKDEEGRNLRPDVVLNLPEGKQIIIDSKVSLTNYVDFVNSEDEPHRVASLERHIVSVRNHIKELSCKGYQDLVEKSPDFVIMFIPNEPAFMTALQTRPELWNEAYAKKIIISSPTNLFALLKIVDDLWRRDTQSKNAIAIAEASGRLYDKFAGFVETLGDIDKNLKKANDSCERAFNQLSVGKGNLISQAEKIKEMGVKAKKQLPENLIEKEEA